jgi:hypothetical protein
MSARRVAAKAGGSKASEAGGSRAYFNAPAGPEEAAGGGGSGGGTPTSPAAAGSALRLPPAAGGTHLTVDAGGASVRIVVLPDGSIRIEPAAAGAAGGGKGVSSAAAAPSRVRSQAQEEVDDFRRCGLVELICLRVPVMTGLMAGLFAGASQARARRAARRRPPSSHHRRGRRLNALRAAACKRAARRRLQARCAPPPASALRAVPSDRRHTRATTLLDHAAHTHEKKTL